KTELTKTIAFRRDSGQNAESPRGAFLMPIQFRCVACQQLLGIARRKAGKVVDCPTCGSKTLVPAEDIAGTVAHEPPPLPPIRRVVNQPISIFDRVDVDQLLQ